MKSYLKLIALVLLSSLVLMSCAKKEAYNSDDFKKEVKEVSEKNLNPESVTGMDEVVEVSDKAEKFKKAMDEVHAMKQGGMKNIKNMYTDLVYVKSSNKGELNNIAGMGKEDWLYSKKYDTTIIVCNHMNTPAYVFEGKDLTDTQISKVKKDMMKMMGDMEGDDGMMMGDMEGHDDMMMEDNDDMMMKNMEGHNDDMKMMKEETKEKKVELAKNIAPGVYKSYTTEAVSSSEKGSVLFFAASWCPSCSAADKDIKAGNIPDGLTILKVDYDTNKELRKKYGITGQHTFVQVDKNGNMIKKWVGGGLDDIVNAVK